MEKMNIFGPLENFKMYEGEDCALGTVLILGVPHHVTFVKVETNKRGIQVGTNDPYERLDDVLKGEEHAARTVKLPGHSGEWVVGVDPHRRG